ncbi:DNA-3-methyladenine glycosylase family protein [Paractinoplanes atraurantiacus]|uniref:3-methyladenine DNA glycosylase/8-oxoguanine DNA glycosylase n=1 Tax=Paractinoplanes atraurantiacus TaxID=1036182 RepID=A0A285IPT8_9ACTN|nr:DNA-3-methyladenine glycosylase 2 family protein [Actinoplanes atraurantiacus]SNY49717.1 3-methyladenine DNA glycosylase/8-oxoguanine DNA glycosylase [Actinoplanes atraurantiacus]
MTSEVTRRLTTPPRYHFGASVGPLLVPKHDPCGRFTSDDLWLAARTPDGPATIHLSRDKSGIEATGYGPGAEWIIDRADAIAGLRDDLDGFTEKAASHDLVARLAKTFAGVRMPSTGLVFPRVLRAILEQKVTGKEAHRSYRGICKALGEPAPGPADLVLPPDPAAIAAMAYWEFHPFGVEQRRTQALQRAAQVAGRLERCADSAEATRRLVALPGIGPWTAAEVVRVVYGDADAVSVGDFHIPNTVAWALAGEARGTDERMLELLEPFRGHRGRVCDLLAHGGIGAPKFGPRMPIRSFARF